MADLHSESIDRLFETILGLENVEECYAFFEDLWTVKEMKDFAQRLDVAMLLDDGLNYQEVAERVNVSNATISRVKKCLEYGAGGYRLAISRKKEKEKNGD